MSRRLMMMMTMMMTMRMKVLYNYNSSSLLVVLCLMFALPFGEGRNNGSTIYNNHHMIHDPTDATPIAMTMMRTQSASSTSSSSTSFLRPRRMLAQVEHHSPSSVTAHFRLTVVDHDVPWGIFLAQLQRVTLAHVQIALTTTTSSARSNNNNNGDEARPLVQASDVQLRTTQFQHAFLGDHPNHHNHNNNNHQEPSSSSSAAAAAVVEPEPMALVQWTLQVSWPVETNDEEEEEDEEEDESSSVSSTTSTTTTTTRSIVAAALSDQATLTRRYAGDSQILSIIHDLDVSLNDAVALWTPSSEEEEVASKGNAATLLGGEARYTDYALLGTGMLVVAGAVLFTLRACYKWNWRPSSRREQAWDEALPSSSASSTLSRLPHSPTKRTHGIYQDHSDKDNDNDDPTTTLDETHCCSSSSCSASSSEDDEDVYYDHHHHNVDEQGDFSMGDDDEKDAHDIERFVKDHQQHHHHHHGYDNGGDDNDDKKVHSEIEEMFVDEENIEDETGSFITQQDEQEDEQDLEDPNGSNGDADGYSISSNNHDQLALLLLPTKDTSIQVAAAATSTSSTDDKATPNQDGHEYLIQQLQQQHDTDEPNDVGDNHSLALVPHADQSLTRKAAEATTTTTATNITDTSATTTTTTASLSVLFDDSRAFL